MRGLLSKAYLSVEDIECALLPVLDSSLLPRQSALHSQLLTMFLVHTGGDYDIYEYVLKKVQDEGIYSNKLQIKIFKPFFQLDVYFSYSL